MSNWEDNNEEHENGLTEIEQLQMDMVLLDIAYNNAYLILSNQISFEELMVSQFKKGGDAIMAFDPDNGPKQEELENMIEHFISTEEYEKCALLKDIMNKAYPQTKNEA